MFVILRVQEDFDGTLNEDAISTQLLFRFQVQRDVKRRKSGTRKRRRTFEHHKKELGISIYKDRSVWNPK